MSTNVSRIACLDGLRGIAALWVLIGHCALLTGYGIPILSRPDLGVDLFMMISGFLMVWQYRLREQREDWDASATWAGFWIRRFFRLSPLYYFLLAVALFFGPQIYADRVFIDTVLQRAQQAPERYTDASMTNIMMHLTYAFGFSPDYAYRTPLPDWSLGLEMQFYLAFPFLVWGARRIGWLPGVLVAFGIGAACVIALKIAQVQFPMPTFLPLKLNVFLAGVLIALDPGGSRARLALHAGLAVVLVAFDPVSGRSPNLTHLAVRETLLIAFFLLVHGRALLPVDALARVFGTRPAHWLGELSYGMYLWHLLLLHPIAAGLVDLPPAQRFAAVTALVFVLSLSLACLTYRFIEVPGQELGRTAVARLFSGRPMAADKWGKNRPASAKPPR